MPCIHLCYSIFWSVLSQAVELPLTHPELYEASVQMSEDVSKGHFVRRSSVYRRSLFARTLASSRQRESPSSTTLMIEVSSALATEA